jgi:type IV secretory pathway VirB2 component (pilin)
VVAVAGVLTVLGVGLIFGRLQFAVLGCLGVVFDTHVVHLGGYFVECLVLSVGLR